MEYVLAGKDGKSHDYFDTRQEAIEALREEEAEREGMTTGWVLLAYDDEGEEVGEPEWAEDLLRVPSEPMVPAELSASVRTAEEHSLLSKRTYEWRLGELPAPATPLATAESFETLPSSLLGFCRLPAAATHTPSRNPREMAVG